MYKTRLLDGSFPHSLSATLDGDNKETGPRLMKWDRGQGESLHTWYTDMHIKDAAHDNHPARVALLLEPPGNTLTHYTEAAMLRDKFNAIFTYSESLVNAGAPFKFYPLGGSWVGEAHRGIHPKEKLVSIIASEKKNTEGQRLRHEVVRLFPSIDVFGRGYNPIESTALALNQHRYSIVIESWYGDHYFSEKLIDCFSTSTIPIYWGCPSIGRFFDRRGILQFRTIKELDDILTNVISETDYSYRLNAAYQNFKRAEHYYCAEDWLVERYPVLFT